MARPASQHAFPETAAGPDNSVENLPEHPAVHLPPRSRKCDGCRRGFPGLDFRHTGDDCAYKHVQPKKTWTCKACLENKPRLWPGNEVTPPHTNVVTPPSNVGGCRWALAPIRESAPRKGQHPRDPRKPATGSTTAGRRGDEVLDIPDAPGAGTSSSSSAPPRLSHIVAKARGQLEIQHSVHKGVGGRIHINATEHLLSVQRMR